MKHADSSDDWVDELLARPAVLADNGFASLVEARLEKSKRLRRIVFSIVAAVSFGLLLTVFSVEGLLIVGEQIGVFLMQFAQYPSFEETAMLNPILAQPSTWILFALALFGASVAVSSALFD